MNDGEQQIPGGWNGLIPTLNNTGFMFEVIDDYARDFITHSGSIDDEVLEFGCAYGVATIAALEAGATVRACDIDQRHLDILTNRAPANLLDKLNTEIQRLPDADLPDNHFGAILCSRVLHFLRGEAVDASVQGMFRWLKPGGHLYLVADSPFGVWREFIPEWEANIANDVRWPGLMEPCLDYLPFDVKGDQKGPPFMNLLSPELLERTCREAGFEIKKSGWIARDDFNGKGKMDGRENCGILAVKPN